ncbi:MAG: hypothetical protein POELPBGB_03290 [Bacteroidia bacterium]|nr:hypothetical protein [Bacteroidia bacterium]
MIKKAFVFVVCGDREHIDTLHFSLNALTRFSNNKIIVVTDGSRNEIPVIHENIINVKTPDKFSHHQASIFLKTSLHKLLSEDVDYCYIDTDVLAVSNEVDTIFNSFTSPITFSHDYCDIDDFSPFAVNCNCYEKFKKVNAVYLQTASLYNETLGKEYGSVLAEINIATKRNRGNLFLRFTNLLKYLFSKDFYVLNERYKLNKKTNQWLNSNNETIEDKYSRKNFIIGKTGFHWSEKFNTFYTKDGMSVTQLKCEHLREQVNKDFDLEINQGWQHWNGGVFLFNKQSHAFMNFWHEMTLKIFENTEWKTRDQGTLAVATWKFGLQNQKTLDINFNFIVDYNNRELKYNGNFTFQYQEKTYKPFFLHVFHHFGDKNWALWQDLEKLLTTIEKQNN